MPSVSTHQHQGSLYPATARTRTHHPPQHKTSTLQTERQLCQNPALHTDTSSLHSGQDLGATEPGARLLSSTPTVVRPPQQKGHAACTEALLQHRALLTRGENAAGSKTSSTLTLLLQNWEIYQPNTQEKNKKLRTMSNEATKEYFPNKGIS